jgi:chromosome partitioning protein
MQPIVITLNGHKGGIGKTTLAQVLAAGMAARGAKVLLIDTDMQSHITLSFNMDAEPGLYQVLVRHDAIVDWLRQPAPESYQIPGEVIHGKLYVLPSNEETAAIPSLVKDARILAQQLALLEDAIDYVIIDTPPSPGLLMSVIYTATDHVIIPTMLTRKSLAGMMATIESVKSFDLNLLGIALNLYERKTVLQNHNLKWLVKNAYANNWRVFTPIGKRQLWEDASQNGCLVWTLEAHSKSEQLAIAEALKFVEQVMGALAHGEEPQILS